MHLPITILANFIIETYFTETKCLLIFTETDDNFDYFGGLPMVISEINGTKIDPGVIFNNFGCQGFILKVKEPRSIFESIEENIRYTLERYNYRRYLLLPVDNPDGGDDDDDQKSLDVSNSEALDYVADVDLILKSNITQGHFDIVTHKYVGENAHTTVVILDRWFSTNQSFLSGNHLYPNKLLNQEGRALRLGTIDYVPYSITDSLDGLDLSILMELAKKLNMSVEIIMDNEVQWGEIYSNFTGNGILGNLVMDRTDIGFASMFIWEAEYHYLDISKQTIKSSISCLVPAPKLVGGWATPFVAFNTMIWIVFAITVVISIVALYFALTWRRKMFLRAGAQNTKFYECLFTSILLTEAMYLNQSVPSIPMHFSTRLVFSMILMMSLVLGAIYDSGLASTMTIPRYYGVIRNPQDMIKHDIPWGATEDAWILSIEGSESPTHKGIVKLFVIENEEKLAERNEDRRFAFAIERLQGGNFAVGSYITEDGAKIRRILDEDLYFDYMAFYLRKSSILLPYLDDIILRVAQAGLLQVWEYNAIARYSNTKIQKIIKDSVHAKIPGPAKLSLSHVEGAFTILIVGLLNSLFCFIGELLLFRYYYEK